jgi:hypothetical protein
MSERKLSLQEQHEFSQGWGSVYDVEIQSAIQAKWYRVPSLDMNPKLYQAICRLEWQRFRGQRLKGESTEEKLSLLLSWCHVWEGTDYWQTALLQVRNYMGALTRGGFVEDITDNTLGRTNCHWVGDRYYRVVK